MQGGTVAALGVRVWDGHHAGSGTGSAGRTSELTSEALVAILLPMKLPVSARDSLGGALGASGTVLGGLWVVWLGCRDGGGAWEPA